MAGTCKLALGSATMSTVLEWNQGRNPPDNCYRWDGDFNMLLRIRLVLILVQSYHSRRIGQETERLHTTQGTSLEYNCGCCRGCDLSGDETVFSLKKE